MIYNLSYRDIRFWSYRPYVSKLMTLSSFGFGIANVLKKINKFDSSHYSNSMNTMENNCPILTLAGEALAICKTPHLAGQIIDMCEREMVVLDNSL